MIDPKHSVRMPFEACSNGVLLGFFLIIRSNCIALISLSQIKLHSKRYLFSTEGFPCSTRDRQYVSDRLFVASR